MEGSEGSAGEVLPLSVAELPSVGEGNVDEPSGGDRAELCDDSCRAKYQQKMRMGWEKKAGRRTHSSGVLDHARGDVLRVTLEGALDAREAEARARHRADDRCTIRSSLAAVLRRVTDVQPCGERCSRVLLAVLL